MKHEPLALPDDIIANLKKLSAYLKGELKAEFSMKDFAEDYEESVTNCGSIGCAIGHGPYAGIEKRTDEDWVTYANRCFGTVDTLFGSGVWSWVFSGSWSTIDDTALGAAKRIDYMLEHGIPRINTTKYKEMFSND